MLRRTHVLASIVASLALAAPALAADSYQPGTTLLLSRSDGSGALPAQADNDSWSRTGGAISADGRFTAFVSGADDLGAPGSDLNHAFARDDQNGAVTLLDQAGPGGAVGNGQAEEAAISADGSRACFTSYADNLVAGVGAHHVYVVTIATGAIVAVDRSSGGTIGDGDADHCALDADGNTVAFQSSAHNLVAGATVGTHVYVRHLDSQTTAIVDSFQGTPGDGWASDPAIDAAGDIVAFDSASTNLNGPGGDTNGHSDVYARTLAAAQPLPLSRATGAAGPLGDSNSWNPSISYDGNTVAFETRATNLGDGDADGIQDVHVRDIDASKTILVSRADGAGEKGNAESSDPAIAGDGSAVAFLSHATNLGTDPGNNEEGGNRAAYLRTLSGHTTTLTRQTGESGAVVQSYTGGPSLDEHATNATFTSSGAEFDPLAGSGFGEVFQRHLAGNFETRLISRPADPSTRPSELGYIDISNHSLSADGRYAVFSATSTFGGPAGVSEVFVRDVLLGTTRLVSRADGADGAPADRNSSYAVISANGTKVAFTSSATNLAPGVDGLRPQVYVRDLATATTTLASVGPNGPSELGSSRPGLSQDGKRVAFVSGSSLVGSDTNDESDVYVRDLVAGTTDIASLTASGAQADASSTSPMISADGTRVGFTSYAKNMGLGGPNDGSQHIYVRDLAAGTTALVDRYADGTPGDKWADRVSMSADGNRFLFSSGAKLTPDVNNDSADAYVRDVAAGTTTTAAIGPNGEHGTKQMFPAGISMDGTKVVFSTYDNAFGTNEPGAGWIRDLSTGTTALVGVRDGTQIPADHSFEAASLDADGNCVAFRSNDSSLASPSYAGRDRWMLWMHVVGGECPVHAPDTTITSGPDGKAKVRQTYSVFAYTGDESNVRFSCSLDDAPMKPCGDTFHTGALRDGVHRFKVAATDRAGNTDPTPALVTFTVGVPPRITKLRLDRRGRLVFKLSEKAKVRVQLKRVGRAHSAAVGKLMIKRSLKGGTRRIKLPLRKLRKGHYHATVTATDAGDNRSVPKRKSFDVRGK